MTSRFGDDGVAAGDDTRSKMVALAALVSGVIFALGLGISGMTQPAKVVGFLDVVGDWDPSLALVMAGAVGVHMGAARWVSTGHKPLFAPGSLVPPKGPIDKRLLAGAAIFGVGWGMAGYCPGPALVSLAAGSPGAIVFVAAMLVAMALTARFLASAA